MEREAARSLPAISVRGVSKRYADATSGALMAVDDVSLEVAPSQLVIVRGRSGSGKTTLLNLIAGLTTPTSGEVTLAGVDLWGLSDLERSRLRNEAVGFVFQFPSLMPMLTAVENVMLPLAFGVRRREHGLDERAMELLEMVGIADKATAYPRQLSAGQQQRAVLARALVNGPRLILADEPTSSLDERTEAEMLTLFRDVHERTRATIVMVTHAAVRMPGDVRELEMASGRVVSDSYAEIAGIPTGLTV